MKKLLSLSLALILLLTMVPSVLASDSTAPSGGMKRIKVGVSADFAPFAYYDNGKLTGFDIDLMNAVIAKTSCDAVEYVNLPFDELISAVVSGEIDCAISAVTVTEERDAIVDFSREYLTKHVYTVGADGVKDFQSTENYAVVFREGADDTKLLSRTPTAYETMYMEIDNALSELSQDKTVLSLMEKYGLDTPQVSDTEQITEYQDIRGHATKRNINASDWAQESIETAKAIHLINPGENYNFPADITREQFCEMIYNYYSLLPNKETAVYAPNRFTDTDNAHIAALNALGIIAGKSETEFAPNDLLTREEAATILFRLICTAHPDWAAHELYFEFTDAVEISDWAMTNIQWICNMGIMQGVGNGKFDPQAHYTTEQAVVTLVRAYSNFNKNASNIIGGADGETEIVLTDLSFADRLNSQMPKEQNYMFSPISIKMALALAANGAEGDTKTEILNALGIESLSDFNALSKDLIERYAQTDILNLHIANSIWINSDQTAQTFSQSFEALARDYYNADVKTVNNQNAVAEINSWVSEKTNQKIPQIVQSTDDFWAMLVNAVYFKGAWLNEFNPSATQKDAFYSADGTTAQIDFMNRTAWMQYAETNAAKMVSLPYLNRKEIFTQDGEYVNTEHFKDLDVSMYLILADDINVAEELEAAIRDNGFSSTFVALSLPKFNIEYSTSLNTMLQNIGIKTAFEPHAAQFEGMFNSGKMWFTDTMHKTFITVDEKGTEAAAVTALRMAGSSLPPEPTAFKLDTPFYFAIRDNTSGEILFMGRYAYAN